MQQRKWQGRTSGGNLGQKGLMFLMRNLNIRLACLILRPVIPFYMLFARRGYEAIYSFFRERLEYSPWSAFVATYRNHYIFGQTLLDKFAVFAGKRDFLDFEIAGQEHFLAAIDDDKGILLAGAHIGNFEIAGYFLKPEKKPVNSLIYGGEAAVMQANRSRVFEEQNIKPIPVSEDLSHIFHLNNAAQQGEIISMPCDRYMGGNKSVEVDFMGTTVHFPLGAFHIANRYGLNVLSIYVLKEGYKKYRVIVKPIAGYSVRELAQNYAASLERIVREYPHQWFNFFDFFDGRK